MKNEEVGAISRAAFLQGEVEWACLICESRDPKQLILAVRPMSSKLEECVSQPIP